MSNNTEPFISLLCLGIGHLCGSLPESFATCAVDAC